MKSGLFGGSFDPVHSGHLAAAKRAKEALGLDRVIFIPSGVSPHKTLTASPEARLEMVKLAVSGIDGFSVSDFETKKKTKCYSYQTVAEFKKLYPDDELYFIIGDDEYSSFFSWYKPNELLSMCRFAVLTRHGAKIKEPFIGISMPPVKISSTMIRERAASRLDLSGLVPPGAAEYIKKNKLYTK